MYHLLIIFFNFARPLIFFVPNCFIGVGWIVATVYNVGADPICHTKQIINKMLLLIFILCIITSLLFKIAICSIWFNFYILYLSFTWFNYIILICVQIHATPANDIKLLIIQRLNLDWLVEVIITNKCIWIVWLLMNETLLYRRLNNTVLQCILVSLRHLLN